MKHMKIVVNGVCYLLSTLNDTHVIVYRCKNQVDAAGAELAAAEEL